METERQQELGENFMAGFATPPLPSTSNEFITAFAHYHRAEIARMAGWRDRIDRTTNWAITGVAAMLSLSLSTPSANHGVLLFAMFMVMLLLRIEARRYQFFDVYRGRVRLIERHYFAQMLAPRAEPDKNWARALGEGLRHPKFAITVATAMSRRLKRNYVWMFFILLLAWLLKITSPKLQDTDAQRTVVHSVQEIIGNAALGPVPGAVVLVAVAAFYGWLVYAALRPDEDLRDPAHGAVHV